MAAITLSLKEIAGLDFVYLFYFPIYILFISSLIHIIFFLLLDFVFSPFPVLLDEEDCLEFSFFLRKSVLLWTELFIALFFVESHGVS